MLLYIETSSVLAVMLFCQQLNPSLHLVIVSLYGSTTNIHCAAQILHSTMSVEVIRGWCGCAILAVPAILNPHFSSFLQQFWVKESTANIGTALCQSYKISRLVFHCICMVAPSKVAQISAWKVLKMR